MATKFDKRQVLLVLFVISIALVALTLVAYEPVRYNGFVNNFDDDIYITENPNVKNGITPHSVIRAFTHPQAGMWLPLTTLSHILDCQFFGLKPSWHHFVNLSIHIANAILLFWLFKKTTSSIWASAFVAAVFALHPLQVESVAWAAERKTVLSGLFWFITMAVYIWYAKRPSIRRYILLFLTYGLCIMTKPVVVTLPFALLLLDYWPLERLTLGRPGSREAASLRQLLIEKIPLVILSAFLSVVTFITHKHGGLIVDVQTIPVNFRFSNAIITYIRYIGKMVWPSGLAVFYPPSYVNFSDIAVIIHAGIFILITALCVCVGLQKKYIIVGWLWFVGTIIPTIGLVQGGQGMADRYMYISMLGLLVIFAWAAKDLIGNNRNLTIAAMAVSLAAIITMATVTHKQVMYWKDTSALFDRALSVTKNNYFIHDNYGTYLCKNGHYEEGIKHLKEAIRIKPDYMRACQNISTEFLEHGNYDEAIPYLADILKKESSWPHIYRVYNNLGYAYRQKGELSLAELNFRKALKAKPDYEPARRNLDFILAEQGKKKELSEKQ